MVTQALCRTTLVLCLAVSSGAAWADKIQDEAQAAADKWDQAYNSGNIDVLKTLYTEDAIVLPKGQSQSGDDISKFFSTLKSKGWDEHKTTVKSAQPKGDVIVVTGRWEMTGPGPDGAKKKFEGNWVNVMERKGEELRTVLHTWN